MSTTGEAPRTTVSHRRSSYRDGLARTVVISLVAAVGIGWGSDDPVEFAIVVACCLVFLAHGFWLGRR